ncbi:carbohydrate ABC transporter permease [Paenibacillus koleovorans]|uniref:carbohydrate ABC transporter permease n=1 Tax=Paenibacillus koleovorans TaxID=121608 RepID=UPI000FDBCFEE|nr:carbohydrate ABC transporter permease [Paenibacillus koleovorans]
MHKFKVSVGDRIFDIANILILTIITLIVLYPLYFVLIASFSDPVLVNSGKVLFAPRGINMEGYEILFHESKIWIGYINSLGYTTGGTLLNIAVTVPCAYALSRKDMKWKRGILLFFIFTMYFHGGLIPDYLLIKQLNLMDTFWSIILPGSVNVYYLLIARTFFAATIPNELLESAKIDGASNTRFLISVVIPLSKALIAVLVLFYALIHWNAWFNASIYLTSQNKWPLQLVLRSILVSVNYTNESFADAESIEYATRLKELVKYGVIIIASVPVLLLYPFIQRYFIKGVMIGSIKG